jgi:hypothetical protein
MLTSLVRLVLSQSTIIAITMAYELEGGSAGVFAARSSSIPCSSQLSRCKRTAASAAGGGVVAAEPVLLSGGCCRVSGQVPSHRVAAQRCDVVVVQRTAQQCGGATTQRFAATASDGYNLCRLCPHLPILASTAIASSVAHRRRRRHLTSRAAAFDAAALLALRRPVDVPHTRPLSTADVDACRRHRWPSRCISAVSVVVGLQDAPGEAKVLSMALFCAGCGLTRMAAWLLLSRHHPVTKNSS